MYCCTWWDKIAWLLLCSAWYLNYLFVHCIYVLWAPTSQTEVCNSIWGHVTECQGCEKFSSKESFLNMQHLKHPFEVKQGVFCYTNQPMSHYSASLQPWFGTSTGNTLWCACSHYAVWQTLPEIPGCGFKTIVRYEL